MNPSLMTPMPSPSNSHKTLDNLKDTVAELNHFLTTAPTRVTENGSIERFSLPDGEAISCILYNDIHHITGTDIVRSLAWRFRALGWNITQSRKFEEGVFSDLRNLKPGTGATLEEPRSDFLKFLYEAKCLRTQKKQKVFYWSAVDHDVLFMDALDRHLKRLGTDLEPGFNLAEGETKEDLVDRARQLSVKTLVKARSSANETLGIVSPVSTVGSFHQAEWSRRASLPLSSPSQLSDTSLKSSPEEHLMLITPDSSDNGTYQNLTHLPPPNDETVPGSYLFHPYPNATARRRASSSSIKMFSCGEQNCGRSFKRFENLRRHSRSHTTDKTYICPIQSCSRSFARHEHLVNHINIHQQQGYEAPLTQPPRSKSLDSHHLSGIMSIVIPSTQGNNHQQRSNDNDNFLARHTRSLSSPTFLSFGDASSFLEHPELGLIRPQEEALSPVLGDGLGSHLLADINGWPNVFGNSQLADIPTTSVSGNSDSTLDLFLYI